MQSESVKRGSAVLQMQVIVFTRPPLVGDATSGNFFSLHCKVTQWNVLTMQKLWRTVSCYTVGQALAVLEAYAVFHTQGGGPGISHP